ncbi:MAG: hypothetical protein ACRDR6_07035 [Pseudonocardiaceae bacterium]
MRLTRLRSTCPGTESCPTLYWTDRGTAVVQGYLATGPEALGDPALMTGETAVEVPFALIAGLTISGQILYATERGTVLVEGTAVTDPEAVATLLLPVGEAAVEIHLSLPTGLTDQEVPS